MITYLLRMNIQVYDQCTSETTSPLSKNYNLDFFLENIYVEKSEIKWTDREGKRKNQKDIVP